MMYICRERNSKDNIITKSGRSLDFFYCTFLGRLLLKIVISKPISDLGGLYMNSRFSKIKINRFIDKNDINKKRKEFEKDFPELNYVLHESIKMLQ